MMGNLQVMHHDTTKANTRQTDITQVANKHHSYNITNHAIKTPQQVVEICIDKVMETET